MKNHTHFVAQVMGELHIYDIEKDTPRMIQDIGSYLTPNDKSVVERLLERDHTLFNNVLLPQLRLGDHTNGKGIYIYLGRKKPRE